MLHKIETALKKLQETKPLVLSLTNYVTMEFMANILLALGASPVMSMCNEELEELVKVAHAVNINIGTLDAAFIERAELTASLCAKYNKPLILDPVGAGATAIRTKTCLNLLRHATIVKGNASEIVALAFKNSKTRGVESVDTMPEAKSAALEIAKQHNCTVIISGPIDFITNGKDESYVAYGSEIMTKITGMGCNLAAVTAAFRGVVPDPYEASVIAVNYFALCGSLTAKKFTKPASFRTAFIDRLYKANVNKFRELNVE